MARSFPHFALIRYLYPRMVDQEQTIERLDLVNRSEDSPGNALAHDSAI